MLGLAWPGSNNGLFGVWETITSPQSSLNRSSCYISTPLQMANNFSTISEELTIQILAYLDAVSLARCAMVRQRPLCL
jgi:hypothetical protein